LDLNESCSLPVTHLRLNATKKITSLKNTTQANNASQLPQPDALITNATTTHQRLSHVFATRTKKSLPRCPPNHTNIQKRHNMNPT
jgi:hypothetical protein